MHAQQNSLIDFDQVRKQIPISMVLELMHWEPVAKGRHYPHPSPGYHELVCTAGITEAGEWVTLSNVSVSSSGHFKRRGEMLR